MFANSRFYDSCFTHFSFIFVNRDEILNGEYLIRWNRRSIVEKNAVSGIFPNILAIRPTHVCIKISSLLCCLPNVAYVAKWEQKYQNDTPLFAT